MRRWMVPVLIAVAALVLGGGGYWAWQAGLFPTKQAAAPAPESVAPVVQAPSPAVLSRTLFPATAHVETFDLNDGTRSTEILLPDGERLVQTYNGVPYITWFFMPDGVRRKDPKGETLLRYLPPELQDDSVWKQPVASGTVWFRLTRLSGCQPAGQAPAECWQLQVLNRGELTTFTFASGLGAVGAAAENYATPAESFTKTLKQVAAGTGVTQQQLTEVLAKGLSLDKFSTAPVQSATAAEFDAALAEVKK
jgi:hypothetical protein